MPRETHGLPCMKWKKIFAEEGIETEIMHIGNKDIRSCIACRSCVKNGKCVFDDMVNEIASKFEACDGLVIGSPVYYASANATLVAFLTRLFFSTHFDKTMKVGASVVAARRGGLSSTFDELNKFFTISGMPIASAFARSLHMLSAYWGFVFFDFEEPLILFLLDYIASMGLFVAVGHYLSEILKKPRKRKSVV